MHFEFVLSGGIILQPSQRDTNPMDKEQLWLEFSALPPQAQTLVLEFMGFVKECSDQVEVPLALEDSSTIQAPLSEQSVWIQGDHSVHDYASITKEDIIAELQKTQTEVYANKHEVRHSLF